MAGATANSPSVTPRALKKGQTNGCLLHTGAREEFRTLDLGKIVLYQLSCSRLKFKRPEGEDRSRTDLDGFAGRSKVNEIRGLAIYLLFGLFGRLPKKHPWNPACSVAAKQTQIVPPADVVA
jgi:hypothetical protein